VGCSLGNSGASEGFINHQIENGAEIPSLEHLASLVHNDPSIKYVR
jgi:hypothetical protein